MEMQNVLVLKGHSMQYEETIRHGSTTDNNENTISYVPYFIDVLEFVYININELQSHLIHFEEMYGGILLTSPRSSLAIILAINQLEAQMQEQIIQKIKRWSIFSVGKATSKPLFDTYGIQCQGEDSGSAEMLATYLHQNGLLPENCRNQSKKMLFLCGEKRHDALPESFKEHHLSLDELIVYKTQLISPLPLPKGCEEPNWVIFFSPSGVKAANTLPVAWEFIKKAAIGKTTAAALQKVAEDTGLEYWKANAIASKPDANALIECMIDYDLQQNNNNK